MHFSVWCCVLYRRYQVNKETGKHVISGHPWIFRGQLSSAATVFHDGDGVRLVDGQNQTLGFAVYASAGAIALRIVRTGTEAPNAKWLEATVQKALAQRDTLRQETNAFRALHGENDGLPGITMDVYAGHGVVQCYVRGLEAMARLAGCIVARELALQSLLQKTPQKQRGVQGGTRVLRGNVPAHATFTEGGRTLAAPLLDGQKSGAFLDLRGARRALVAMPLGGARVLDLFAYGGSLGLAAAAGGAASVLHVDQSEAALADVARVVAAANDASSLVCQHTTLACDLFTEWPALLSGPYELIICDPPQMTSRMEQVGRALTAYHRLYARVAARVAPGGRVLACCCTQRITEPQFLGAVQKGLGAAFRLVQTLPQEVDHPIGFAQGGYLKIALFERA